LLAQEIAAKHPGRVRFVEENFGESALAERFGVEQYPAIFVDEALVAGPWDFFAWPNTPKGRYVPFLEAANRERFKEDLERFVERRLAGEELANASPSPTAPPRLEALPAFEAVSLAGETLSSESLSGKIVLVEFWATWCPPCRSTLSFLSELQRRDPEKLAVLPIAVSSEEEEVRRLLAELAPSGRAPSTSVMGTDELVTSFGGVLAVPTLMVFGPDGETEAVFYGAPPDLHKRVSRLLEELESRGR
jgi:thiol-disulfide isomerase/thioredoxin